MYYIDKEGNSIVIQENGLILITPVGNSTRIVTLQEIISQMELCAHDFHNTAKKFNFISCYFEELYELCNRVYTERPGVKNFNEYVKNLVLKDLEEN